MSPRSRLLLAFFSTLFAFAIGSPGVGAQEPETSPLLDAKDGLSINEPKAFQGYSLIAPMNSTSTYLVDMEGRIVNEWESDYTPALSADLLENGHLLRPAAERGFGGRPGAGGRIQEFDWDGELVWDYSFPEGGPEPHHDICRLPNGNVLVIATDKKTGEEALAKGRHPDTVDRELLPDCILEIRPTGKTTGEIVWEWHAWDHLIQDLDRSKPNYGEVSEHPERIDLNFGSDLFAQMIADPQQLARLRSLGYVGDAPPRDAGDASEAPEDKEGEAGTPDAARSDAARDAGGARVPDGSASRKRRGRGPGGPGGPPGQNGDWMHTNSIAYNEKLDQILLSIHEFSEVWIIDHGTTTEEARGSTGGKRGKGGDLLYRWGNPQAYRNGSSIDQKLFAQHCAHWIPEGLPGAGNMLVFNNGNRRPGGEYSSVDEIVLPLAEDGTYTREEYLAFGPESASWSYSAPDKKSFYSMLISGAQRLPNGNTFICSGNQGIVFEVTPEGEVVWLYKHPGAGFGFPGGPRRHEIFPDFLQRTLGLNDEQKKALGELQTEIDAKIATLLTEEQRKKLEQLGFPGGPPGPPGPGARGGPDRADRGAGPDGAGGPVDGPDRTDRPRGPGDARAPGAPGRFGGPRGFRPPRVGDVISAFVIDSLELTEAQTAELTKIQEHADSRIAEILSEDQKTRLDEMQRGFFGPGAGPGAPGGPGGFGGFPPGAGPGPDGGRDRTRRPDPDGDDPDGRDGGPDRPRRDGPDGFGPGGRGPGGFGPGGPGGFGRGGPGGFGRGPGGRGGPGGPPGGGPGGLFRAYRYGVDHPAFDGRTLEPGRKLAEIANPIERPAGTDGRAQRPAPGSGESEAGAPNAGAPKTR